jgi:hypothetical protein
MIAEGGMGKSVFTLLCTLISFYLYPGFTTVLLLSLVNDGLNLFLEFARESRTHIELFFYSFLSSSILFSNLRKKSL